MSSLVLQNWLTPRGNASSGVLSIAQGATRWLDVGDAVDATFWVDCREVTNPTGGNVTLNLETSPNKDEVMFMPVTPPITLAPAATPITVRTVLTPNTVPLSRWIRWRLSVGSASTGQWDATIRLAMTTSPFSYFLPTQVAGCMLWLRGDLGITIGAGVSSWADQSGQGNNATQGTGTKQPAYSSSGGSNAQPAITFNGTSDYLSGSGTPLGGSATLFAVLKYASTAGTTVPWSFGGTGTGFGFTTGVGVAAAREISGWGFGTESDGTATTNWETWSATIANAAQAFRVNGTAVSLPGSVGITAPSATWTIGCFLAGLDLWSGSFAELIAYNSILSATDIARVESYLRGRYATW
jgi:hypothetical protein